MTLLTAPDEAAALEQLHALGCTDGLPVVIPTPERVARMVLASGLEGDMVLGLMGPAIGAATVEKVATSAVMAGCLPDYMPIVLAAARAVCESAFDLTEMQSTTHCTAPLIIVNGPARHGCGGVSSGFGALGPGPRANASIGRALRLCMINIGGGRAGVSDMALLGHPGKFSYCLAENEEDSPFTPLHEARGFGTDQSVVTVVGVEAPHSVIAVLDADDPTSADRLLDSLAAVLANVGSNNAHFGGGSAVVVLNPDHAQALAAAGFDRDKVAEVLRDRAANPLGLMRRLNPAMAARPGGDETLVHAFRSPRDILVLMAGGGGLYSMVMPSWGAGPHANPAVSVVIETDQSCEVPGASPGGGSRLG